MRLWSLHPSHLDRIGLVACWREALLAQSVLAGQTKGYLRHPQLERFREQPDPLAAIGAYLAALHEEAVARGYRFDATKIRTPDSDVAPIPVTTGQLDYEWRHLGAKLEARSEPDAARWRTAEPGCHPLFRPRDGDIATWERPHG